MTVGELRRALAGLDDGAEVYVEDQTSRERGRWAIHAEEWIAGERGGITLGTSLEFIERAEAARGREADFRNAEAPRVGEEGAGDG